MNTSTIVWLIAASALFLIGCIILGVTASLANWDLSGLSTSNYETYEYIVEEEFSGILLSADTADIAFVRAEDGTCKVVCYEETNRKSSVTVTSGVLTVNATYSRKWYEHIGINFDKPTVTVYLPESEYASLSVKSHTGELTVAKGLSFDNLDITQSTGRVLCHASAKTMKIKTTTGDITVEGITADSADLSVSTGNVRVTNLTASGDVTVSVTTGKAYLTDVNCQSLSSRGSTGDIHLKNVIAAERFSIKRSTGDVIFDGADAAEITVETDTGDVEGSLLTGKIFTVRTDTGRKDYPDSVTGGICKITTDTGDVRITVTGE